MSRNDSTATVIPDDEIVKYVSRPDYLPVKIKVLARKLGVPAADYKAFRDQVRRLIEEGRLQFGRARTVRVGYPSGTVVGVYRHIRAGHGVVRPIGEVSQWPEIHILPGDALDAASGDEVLVRIRRRGPRVLGTIIKIIERAADKFVGTYFEYGGPSYVRVDGDIFHQPIRIEDGSAKGVKQDEKVVIEMLRFPSSRRWGEATIVEVLGGYDEPGVDTLSIIREFGLPDTFSKEALEEAKQAAEQFDETKLLGRRDFTAETIVTIDPADAHDFDDAVHVKRLENGNWELGVHIADVSYFVKPGSAMDREAKERGTTVYLPGKVLHMLPPEIAGNLASLIEGAVRYTKTVLVEISPEGTILHTQIMPSAIKVTKRLDFDTVNEALAHPRRWRDRLPAEVLELLKRMQELAALLRERRIERGFLELDLPEVKLELDEQGRFKAARLVTQDESHRIIEEFMLTANEAVAQYLADRDLPFLRRTHEEPEPHKLKAFAEFVRALNYRIDSPQSRAELQAVLRESMDRPERYAVHYSLLRSMKRAEYSPDIIGHYGIASECYCHFTSPIRRYPDLLVHRVLERHWKRGKVKMDERELYALGQHCTYTERRAADAEAELIKLKILTHLADRVGVRVPATITSVHDFGFFAQLDRYYVEGLVHVRTLGYERFRFDPDNYTLRGTRSGRIFRLGDRVQVRVAHVDLNKRKLELHLLPE